jgi:hypothetical protein
MYAFKVEMSTCIFDSRSLTVSIIHKKGGNPGGKQWKVDFLKGENELSWCFEET